MKLKSLLFPLFLISIVLIGYSQSGKNETWTFGFKKNIDLPLTQSEIDKIIFAYGSEKLQSIISVNALKKYYKNILRNRVKIYVKKYYFDENIPKLSSIGPNLDINIINSKKFNPLLYDFPFFSKKSHYYRVGQTDYLVVINPQELE